MFCFRFDLLLIGVFSLRLQKKPATAEELDRELMEYNLKNEERGKDYLDAQLEEYSRQRDTAPAAPAAATPAAATAVDIAE